MTASTGTDVHPLAWRAILDGRVSMDRLLVAIGGLDLTTDVHTRDRLVEEMARIAAETKVTLGLARRRADLVKGLDAEEIIAAAGRTSLAGAAVDLSLEDAFVAERLNGPASIPPPE